MTDDSTHFHCCLFRTSEMGEEHIGQSKTSPWISGISGTRGRPCRSAEAAVENEAKVASDRVSSSISCVGLCDDSLTWDCIDENTEGPEVVDFVVLLGCGFDVVNKRSVMASSPPSESPTMQRLLFG